MFSAMNPQPFGTIVDFKGVTVQVVVRGYKINVTIGAKEVQHSTKLVWEVEIVVLREINEVAVGLRQQNINLFPERREITYTWNSQENQILLVEILRKYSGVVFWTAVQQDPNLDAQTFQCVLERA